MRKIPWIKYAAALAITSAIFFTAISLSAYINNRRISDMKDMADRISIDILSSETQYSLLAESSCDDLGNSALSEELNALAEKLSYTAGSIGNDTDLTYLKNYYALLEIKDYLLMKKVSQKCGVKPVSILYFYSTEDCPECERQGYVLTYLREKYPGLRVYSFDYDLELSALRTLISIHDIGKNLPATIINGRTNYGLKTSEEIETMVPELADLATSTPKSPTER